MDRFALSERWCPWTSVDVIFSAVRIAIEAGPLDPPICEVVFDEDYDPFTVDTLEEAQEHLRNNRVRSMEIIVSHIDDDAARLTPATASSSTATAATGRVRAPPTTPRTPCSPATTGSRRSRFRSCRATPSPRRASAW